MNQYAAAILRQATRHPTGVGAVAEDLAVRGQIDLNGVDRLPPDEEAEVLRAAVDVLLDRSLCMRELGLLIFPSEVHLSRPREAMLPACEVSYTIGGALETIYSTLVVRLGLSPAFRVVERWRNAAEFLFDDRRMGFELRGDLSSGTANLDVYFQQDVDVFARYQFLGFIKEHLHSRSITLHEHIQVACRRHYCAAYLRPIERAIIEQRRAAGKPDVVCQLCDTRILLPGSLEDYYRDQTRDSASIGRQEDLNAAATKNKEAVLQEFRSSRPNASAEPDRLAILHLSDLHLGTRDQAELYLSQLTADLRFELRLQRLHTLVVTGDIANRSTDAEYDAAYVLLDGLLARFGLDPDRLVLVPGNHDQSWPESKAAYRMTYADELPRPLLPDRHIPLGEIGALLRDDTAYPRRFDAFHRFCQRVYKAARHPLLFSPDVAQQFVLRAYPGDGLAFLGLNSAHEIDHHFKHRASIHPLALSRALDALDTFPDHNRWLKIALWHHPTQGHEAMNGDFLQRLAVHGFSLGLHGHIHEAQAGHYRYDERGVHLLGAGTFGAPTKEQVPGIPLQYQVLLWHRESSALTVMTRKREKLGGAWSADARWGDKNQPQPNYVIKIHRP